jgi:hypothetical protein
MLSESEISAKLASLSTIFKNIRHENVSFQLIFDSEPTSDIALPQNLAEPKTSAERILADRVQAVCKSGKLCKRTLILTIRVSSKEGMARRTKLFSRSSELELELDEFLRLQKTLALVCQEVEYCLSLGGFSSELMGRPECLDLLRSSFHSLAQRSQTTVLPEAPLPESPLKSQILRDFITMSPRGVEVGEDTWELCSWLDQPPRSFHGQLCRVLELKVPYRVVLNVRPCLDSSDLETKMVFLKNAADAYGEMQRDEIRLVQDQIARGEGLAFAALHIMVRNQGVSLKSLADKGAASSVVSQLRTYTQVDFLVEKLAAPAIFLSCLPFGYSPRSAHVSGREKRVLAASLAPYLPVFDGFQGTKSFLQLMVSRAANAITLNPFDSETSPHVAVLASSGGGKSFFAQNLMMSFFAKKPDGLVFIIDKKTSYEIFARVVGEDFGSQIVKPPEYYPNIFQGELDELRLPIIIGILKTALSLVSKGFQTGAVEEMLLSEAVRASFEQTRLDSQFAYENEQIAERTASHKRIPKLSDVVQNLVPLAAKLAIPKEVASELAANLSPFVGSGPYAALFDKLDFETIDPKTPGVSLFDIDAVGGNPILSTLTSQMILAEILRQVRRPENRGRPGLLVIEEAGVLAGGSPELVAFIQDAWKTFRKLGFSCIGLTNEVDDYLRKPGPREIWNISPNKVILKMSEKDLEKAVYKDANSDAPALISDPYTGRVLGSLVKRDGEFSQGLWISEETRGTFIYAPTGYDYWCAASKPVEVEAVCKLSSMLAENAEKPFFTAVTLLARSFPRGVRQKNGALRELSAGEMRDMIGANV